MRLFDINIRRRNMIKNLITNIKGIKFLLLLGVFLIVIILPADATFVRRILYMLAGGYLQQKLEVKKWY